MSPGGTKTLTCGKCGNVISVNGDETCPRVDVRMSCECGFVPPSKKMAAAPRALRAASGLEADDVPTYDLEDVTIMTARTIWGPDLVLEVYSAYEAE